MSDCSWLSDRMPSVALGRGEWTADELRHLSTCSSCQREWELLRATGRLGEVAAAEVDMASLTHAVLQRLGRSPAAQRKRQGWGLAGLAAAAALAGILWTGRSGPPVPDAASAPIVARLQIPLPELEELQPAELDSVLRGMDQPGPDIDTLETSDSRAIDDGTVYDYWEG